jgi:peptidyl-prolyl cis-trans isomerase D
MIRFLQNPGIARKVMFGFIVGILIFAMVGYLGSYFGNNSARADVAGIYASVGAEQVTVQQVREAAQRAGQQMTQGRAIPQQFMPFLNQRAANDLVIQAALVEEAHRMGLHVSDDELKSELRNGVLGRELFPNGQFVGNERYQQFVRNFNMSVPEFERIIKRDLLISKLQNIVTSGATVSDADVGKAYQQQNVKVKFDYAVLSATDLMKKVPVTESELRAYYAQNQAGLANSIPERRKARYIAVDASKVPVQVTDEDYKRAYEARKDQFVVPEQIDVRHILVKGGDDKKPAADAIKKQLDAGADFATLAKKMSEDEGSSKNGGLYTGILRKQFVPEFEQVAFSQPVGKISDPVKTSFGWHIIRTEAHRPQTTKSLEEVKGQLEPELRAQKGAAALDSLATQIATQAKAEGLDKAAAKHGLTVVNTDFFSRDATLPGIGNSPQFTQQVFAMKPDAPAEKITTEQGAVVAQVTAVQPPATPTFEQAKQQLENRFRAERANQMLAQKTQELADRSRALNDLRKAAKEVGATVKTSDLVTPTAQVPDLGSLAEGNPGAVAFNLKPGQISGALAAGQSGVVLKVLERQEPTASEFEKQKDQLRSQLLQQKRNEVMQLFALHLKDKMLKDGALRINQREQNNLFGNAAGS